jgi:hypothetical protein
MRENLWNNVTLNTFIAKDVIRVYENVLEQNPGLVVLGGNISEYRLRELEIYDLPLVLSYDHHLRQLFLDRLDVDRPLYPNPEIITYLAPENLFLKMISNNFE